MRSFEKKAVKSPPNPRDLRQLEAPTPDLCIVTFAYSCSSFSSNAFLALNVLYYFEK